MQGTGSRVEVLQELADAHAPLDDAPKVGVEEQHRLHMHIMYMYVYMYMYMYMDM